MTDSTQPEALRLAELLELAPEDGVEPQTAEDAAAELRRLHTENTALQQGYAAARLEIESLQAKIKTMAEEHADELMVAHLDGRMREAQAAPQQEAQEPCPSCRNSDIYACTCTFPTSRNAASQPAPAAQGDALDAAKQCLEMGESFRALRRVVNLLLEARRNLGPEDHELRDRIDQLLRADTARAARDPAGSVTAPAGGVDDDVDAIALARYKVVPAHESMFHRFAVVAGDGKQQLYLGREIECANMARKFAGAFLDGAFYQANIAPTPPAQTADSVLEDAARYCYLRDVPMEQWPAELLTAIRLQQNAKWDTAIDAARKQGVNHD